MSNLPAVTDATFGEAVERAPGLSAVDFAAEWCAPCRIVAPVLESLAGEYASRVRVMSMDADANPATMSRFGVRGLPTVLFFRDGVAVDRVVGAVPRAAYQQKLDALLAG